MARIGVEQKALTDARFGRLATLAGYADADHAIGKMIRLWNECQERESDTLPLWLVESHLGARGAESLVPAELAALVPNQPAMLRIRGCAGRTDWLGNNRKSAQAGGKARAASASRAGGRFTSRAAGGADQLPAGVTASAPAPAPAPAPALSLTADKPRRQKASGPVPADWKPSADHQAIARENGVDCEREAERMRDWCAAGGPKAHRADWDAAFRNWLRNQQARGTGNTTTSMAPVRRLERLA